jgi:four helix bundle protein
MRRLESAMDDAVAVYEFIASLPEQEKYNLASQLRRAATSAPLNTALSIAGATSNAAAYALMQKVDPGNPLR